MEEHSIDLIAVAKKAIEAALRAGAEQAEAYASRGMGTSISIERGDFKTCKSLYDYGLCVRSYVKGGMGFSYTQRITEKDAVEIGKASAKLARQAQPDPDFISLPEPKKVPEVPGLYDKELAELDVEEFSELMSRIVDAARISPEVIVNCSGSYGYGEYALVNSLGVEIEGRRTGIGFSAFCIVKRGDDIGSFYEWDSGRSLRDVDPEKVGKVAGEGAIRFLGAKKVKTATLPVVFKFLPAAGLISSLIGAANAESIHRKRSYLVDMLGKRIASDILTVYDDGTVERGIASSTYDAEGVPKRRFVVIEKGILKTYLHNSYTANKMKAENNACASRAGYSSPPGIGSSNIQIVPGDISLNEMIAEMREGIVVETGFIWADPITGTISQTIDFGFKIENGEYAYPLKGTLIGSRILDLMRNIDAISKEYREEPGFIWPAIRVKDVRIAGGA